MQIIDFVLSTVISALCTMGSLVIFAGVLLSWISPDADGPLFNFVYNVSDFLTAPARAFLNKTGLFSGLPLDFSPMLTMILLSIIGTLFTIF